MAHAAVACAQGSVRGTVTVLDRPGVRGRDAGNAVVMLEPVGRTAYDGPNAPAAARIDMRGREFRPHMQFVRVGGTVTFPNSDPFSHNVFSNSALGAFDLGLYRAGVTKGAKFERPGVYAIYCNIHARMVSFVLAITSPFVAEVDASGRFDIKSVPVGSYRVRVWHERTPEVLQDLVVPVGGLTGISLVVDARGYVPTPHPNKFGAAYAATRADRY